MGGISEAIHTCLEDSEVKFGWVRRISISPLDSAPTKAERTKTLWKPGPRPEKGLVKLSF